MGIILDLASIVASTVVDVLPIAAIVLGFQIFVIRRPLAEWPKIAAGFALVIAGLAMFLLGLEQALFPLGRLMAAQLTSADFLGVNPATASWPDYYWVYAFAFAIGFGTTLAEPSLLAVALKAKEVSGGAIGVHGLRVAVAIGVAVGVSLGCARIVTGAPLHYFMIAGYALVVVQTMVTPKLIVPLAYDSGGVTTSTVTVPLITALGLGLAETVPGRSPILDGFGLVAFASLFPIMAVQAYAQLTTLSDRFWRKMERKASAAKEKHKEISNAL
jgi:hypothetical protein